MKSKLMLSLIGALAVICTDVQAGPNLKASFEEREALRTRIKELSLDIDSKIEEADRAENLVDEFKFKNLAEMGAAQLTQAKLAETPWSDSYWPIYQGMLANRYADPEFPASSDWKANNDYVIQHLGQSHDLNMLSPAEKYDLIVGDTNYTLTKAMLADGKAYYDNSGKVEAWMGLCHGWAPAAYMVKRPERAIQVMAADGVTLVPLYPSDIKALTTLVWSNGDVPTRFIGGRCNDKEAPVDGLGRPSGNQCIDNNPGTWHLAVVNQIGVSKRSFVMDATWNYQVWNQPVYSYSYTYFNPITKNQTPDLKLASVLSSQYLNDPYKSVRAPETNSIVGVKMTVQYIVENQPSTDLVDSSAQDSVRTVSYLYDLELNQQGDIVGGEWLNTDHPDFLWSPVKDSKAMSPIDYQLDRLGSKKDWDGKTSIPQDWKQPAQLSSRYSMPLGRIVYSLISLSRGES
jgi:hypothetical protein